MENPGSFASLAAALDQAAQAGGFTTIATALDQADLMANADVGGPFTVFAPTDAAFEQIDAETLGSLLDPANKEQLTRLLGYHVLPGRVLAGDAVPGTVRTISGEEVDIAMRDGQVMINDARVLQADILAGNGVVHVIDRVLIPASVSV